MHPISVPTEIYRRACCSYYARAASFEAWIFALRTALRAAEIVGSISVITHPLDDGVRACCAKWGFQHLPFDPRRAMLVRTVDLRSGGICP